MVSFWLTFLSFLDLTLGKLEWRFSLVVASLEYDFSLNILKKEASFDPSLAREEGGKEEVRSTQH